MRGNMEFACFHNSTEILEQRKWTKEDKENGDDE